MNKFVVAAVAVLSLYFSGASVTANAKSLNEPVDTIKMGGDLQIKVTCLDIYEGMKNAEKYARWAVEDANNVNCKATNGQCATQLYVVRSMMHFRKILEESYEYHECRVS